MNIVSLAVPFLVGGVVGIALGAIVALLFTGGKKEEAPEPQVVEKLPEGINRGQHVELARLWRERAGGKLLVEVTGRILPDAAALTAGQRNALESAIREWALWLGLGKTPAKPAAPAQPAAPVQPATAPQPAPAAPQVVPPAAQPAAMPAIKAAAAQPAADARPKSMVEQIDDIVQEMLPHSPVAGHTLRVRSDPREGVLVWLDAKKYAGVGEVDDPQAKALLQAAAAEWERRAALDHGWK